MKKYIENLMLHIVVERWEGGQSDLKLMMDFLLRVKLVDFMFGRFRMKVEEEEGKRGRESGKMFFEVLEEFIVEGRIKYEFIFLIPITMYIILVTHSLYTY